MTRNTENICTKNLYYLEEKSGDGIYLLQGDVFPIQVIVTKELSAKENLWLHSLTDDMKSEKEAEELVRIYEKHQRNILYESVMDVIVKANHEKFKEVSGMCQALVEIMQPYIDEQVELQVEKAEERIMELIRMLLAAGRMEDLNRAIDDGEYRSHLCEELALS